VILSKESYPVLKLNRRRASIAALGAVGVFIVAGAASCDPSSSSQQQAQQTTDSYQQAATGAVPYPLNQMKQGGWTERKLLQEHLLRQNDPNGTRWVVWLSQQGQVIAQWPIKGMVFDPNSQLTNSQSLSWSSNGGSGVVQAPGDNGTWGPESGAAAFFTTSGVEIQLPPAAIWVESDSPLNITDKPLITYNVDAKPSVDHGGLQGVGH
jgi:hypothetical protein